MLVVRGEQMAAFEDVALRSFEDEMVLHSKTFTPRLCTVLGEEQLRIALRQAMSRAGAYGFTYRGPLRLYIELMFLCGSDFDSDLQYPAIREVLDASDDQMQRAEQIYEGVVDYQAKVVGPHAANVFKALRALSDLVRQDVLPFSSHLLTGELFRELTRAFPEKAKYVGEAGLKALIDEGCTEAQKYGFSTVRGQTLIVVLMFAFGHGCTHDPLYPWISRTLTDEKIVDAAARAKRLEKKAVTWLDHVLARRGAGEPA